MVTILIVFLIGITVPVLAAAVAWYVHRRSHEEGTRFFNVCANTQGGRWKGKEPIVFSGRPADFAEWRFSMDEALAVARVPPTEEVSYAVSFLSGDARRWFMTQCSGENRPKDWPILRDRLKEAFSPDLERALNRSNLLKIRQTGSLEDYIEDFRRLSILTPEVDELTRTTIFTEGLKKDIRRAVKLSQVERLQSAIRIARSALQVEESELAEEDRHVQSRKDVDLSVPPPPPPTLYSSSFRTPGELGIGRFRSNKPLFPGRPTKRSVRCFRCGQLGHIARFCRQQDPNAYRQ